MFYQNLFLTICVIEALITIFAFTNLKEKAVPDFKDGILTGILIMGIIHIVLTGIFYFTSQPTAMDLYKGNAEIEYIYDTRAKKNESPIIIDSIFVFINKEQNK